MEGVVDCALNALGEILLELLGDDGSCAICLREALVSRAETGSGDVPRVYAACYLTTVTWEGQVSPHGMLRWPIAKITLHKRVDRLIPPVLSCFTNNITIPNPVSSCL